MATGRDRPCAPARTTRSWFPKPFPSCFQPPRFFLSFCPSGACKKFGRRFADCMDRNPIGLLLDWHDSTLCLVVMHGLVSFCFSFIRRFYRTAHYLIMARFSLVVCTFGRGPVFLRISSLFSFVPKGLCFVPGGCPGCFGIVRSRMCESAVLLSSTTFILAWVPPKVLARLMSCLFGNVPSHCLPPVCFLLY